MYMYICTYVGMQVHWGLPVCYCAHKAISLWEEAFGGMYVAILIAAQRLGLQSNIALLPQLSETGH